MSEANGEGVEPALPDGWVWKALGEIVRTSSGGTPSRKRPEFYEDGTVPWLKIGDLNDGVVDQTEERITEEGLAGSSAKKIPAGTLVIAMYGSIGKLGVLGIEAATNQAICALEPGDDVCRDYLFWYLRGQRDALLAAGFGGTQANISQTFLKQVPIALPPLEDQRQIVDTLEHRVAHIGRGSSLLREMTVQFEEFRASLREAACLGTLLGPALPRPARADGPGPLPDGWEWKTLAEFATRGPRGITDGPFGSNLKSSHYTDSGPRVIRLQNVGDGVFLDAEVHISQAHFDTLRAHEAKPGDVILASLGDDLPRACVVPDWLGPAIVKADCPRIRPSPNVNPHFLAACLNSRPIRRQAATVVHGVGRTRLKLLDAKKLKVPFPQRAEQDQIVARLNEVESGARRLEQARDRALEQARMVHRALIRDAMGGTPLAPPRREMRVPRSNTALV